MSQSTKRAGRPTKRPRLVKHTASLDAPDQVHHDRHCIFSLQPSGRITLRTTYIPPNLMLDDPGESTLFDAQPEPADTDPWNEVGHFTPVICEDANLGSEALKDHPISLWLPERQTFMHEFIRLEGRGKHANSACQCGAEHAVFRCQDCFSVQLACCSCTIQSHVNVPLHRIKEWKDGFFHPVSLKSMGLRVQLGHHLGTTCRRPKPAYSNDFVIIDVHRIHKIALDFCGCEHEVSHFKQLLRARWFPSTVTNPRTAATFPVLEFFHILSFESKDRYSVFLRMVIEWRNCKALKCSGCGHDPNGVHFMNDGDLAVLCPAYPHPGKNLPDDWETAPDQWKYGLFIAVDANFRLKHRMVSSDEKDPGLSRGWGYFVDETDYKCHLSSLTGITQEKSTCVSHNTVNMADTKSWKGLAATGVGTVDCARHDMKLVNGVGDLQRGERYVFLFQINISYDVACQWYKKLWPCMSMLPSHLHFNQDGKVIKFLVPKFHLAAHIEVCQTEFSFNWTPGVGRTDGEAPERGWANMNRVASSTKEMGPGARRDTLNDHFGDSNWKKVTALGRALLRKISNAVASKKEHRCALHDFQGSITESEVGAASLSIWRAEIEAWEIDHSQPNPFQSRVATMTQAAVRLELAKQDAKALEDGSVVSLHAEVTCSVFLSTDVCALSQHSTDIQRTKMPMVPNLRASASLIPPNDNDNDDSGCLTLNPNSGNAEDFQLLLPSELCNIANDALNECRSHIRVRHQLYQYKTQHVRGQGASTRAWKTLDAVEEHLMLSHAKYVSAHNALVSLSCHMDCAGWEQKLQPLKKAHLRPMGDFGGQTQGTAIMSWIWLTHGISTDDNEGLQDLLHVEWCKARARHNRWSEEIQLLLEEMQCVLRFLDWRAEQWDSQASRSSVEQPKEDAEGFVAYARRQAHIHRRLAAVFKESWRKIQVRRTPGGPIPEEIQYSDENHCG
ncbi:uncharacterized protein F5891DRAFT_1129642 [Suillus fuscotomentosus]|uniref:CxC2-like cysteine cluster KDZ transposase-associated domain-containing protein n=1 Tax=Suillus fuscotomentosus TaxID=1912939 RepID=A0AAD4E1R4_9AGAM|nr:uncharacterized protein F5891DRAFT_1129642 [Suillus fuscotomentosus]KAG1897935.1 hypothetical protein F5891DRAFT_1129642 [Suillus fuscotomentosus]